MKNLGAWPFLGALLLLALVVSLAAGSEEQVSVTPSITNPGPRGTQVLFTWLSEAKADVRAGRAPLTEVPADIATIVIPAPRAAKLSADELESVRSALARGVTVVLMVARDTSRLELGPLVKLRSSGAPPIESKPNDAVGSTLSVVHHVDAVASVGRLRVASEPGLTVLDDDALPLTEPAGLWALRRGQGVLYVAAGADLAENARLDLEQNSVFWSTLAARGPMWFDEFHHQAQLAERPTVNLWAFGLQFTFVAALFVVARGARLGTVRREPPPPLRSSAEYVEAMARLTHRAKLEPELVEALKKHARLLLHERLGISLQLSDDERARASGLDGVAALFRDQNFLSLSRRLSALEAELHGRKAG